MMETRLNYWCTWCDYKLRHAEQDPKAANLRVVVVVKVIRLLWDGRFLV